MGINRINGGTSSQKSDIILDVSHNEKLLKDEGFGIKSYLGSKPTLLNASGSNTNFIFEIKNFKDEYLEEINNIQTKTKISDRINRIYNLGCHLDFQKVEAETMQYNLMVLDNEMPELMANLILNFYKNRQNSLKNNLEGIYKNESNESSFSLDYSGYEIKIKRFLVAILLGMFSGKKWDGNFTSNGTIVVKTDGSQVVFHIIKLNILENFLFENIKFDTPSSTRHRFAMAYKEADGKFYFKLNLQLRF